MSGPDDELLEQWRLELQRLGEQLLMAGTAANWEQVRELDRRIAGILRKLQQSPKLKTLLAERLVILQQQHHQRRYYRLHHFRYKLHHHRYSNRHYH